MSLTGKHVLSSDLFDREELERLFVLADLLTPVARGRKATRVLEGAVMASLFFEASTRTRLSCESAFLRLGGGVVNSTGPEIMSIAKGESYADTSRVVSGYCDLLVVRHPEETAVHEFAAATNVPVINGGNGAGEHPTQALLDMYTLHREFARTGRGLDNRRIALVGDLRYGRTVHSLMKLITLYENLTIVCVSPAHLGMPAALLESAERRGHRIELSDSPQTALKDADLVYATRLQTERFAGQPTPYSDEFRIDKALVSRVCRDDTVIMHPLPRNSRPGSNDLAADLNSDPRLAIFRQTDAGIPIRMALFVSVLGAAEAVPDSLRRVAWYRPEYTGPDDAPFYRNTAG
ncbi:aspartate carbamoyltransferase [Streptomyces sp. CSDS2]|uniref:aspartate carbamoyltransferase n=1 Tax=Streptomyces sp. CSDS2 TaxID=3055051 RepID=UPI0025B005D6|nr:aspartate carbamoyltransferase [Streptomyces sp. CSDS2]MDN3260521.1 aspartate carbamoyltransferase [Streptomyces sp. CSDS2]